MRFAVSSWGCCSVAQQCLTLPVAGNGCEPHQDTDTEHMGSRKLLFVLGGGKYTLESTQPSDAPGTVS
jgi:hypothetical protein